MALYGPDKDSGSSIKNVEDDSKGKEAKRRMLLPSPLFLFGNAPPTKEGKERR